MYLETTCTEISIDRWNELMLQYYNPWAGDCCETKTHYILVHSAIEYFIHK